MFVKIDRKVFFRCLSEQKPERNAYQIIMVSGRSWIIKGNTVGNYSEEIGRSKIWLYLQAF